MNDDTPLAASPESARSKRRLGRWLVGAALLVTALLVGAAAGGFAVWKKLDDDIPPVSAETIFGVKELPDGAYSFVVSDGTIRVYDIGRSHTLVKMVRIPDRYTMRSIRGVAADASSHR